MPRLSHLILLFTVLTSRCLALPCDECPDDVSAADRKIQPGTEVNVPGKMYPVEHGTTEFSYLLRSGDSVERRLSYWYPVVTTPNQDGQKSRERLDSVPMAVGKHPLVVFSHGNLSAPEISSYILETLAASGFVVVGVHHEDSISELRKRGFRLPPLQQPSKWTASSHTSRRDDVRAGIDFVVNECRDDASIFYNRIQTDRIGAMGHSLGGYTICGLVGGWPSWHDKRIRCALLVSPNVHPFLKNTSSRIRVPVMLQGAVPGDPGITPILPEFYASLQRSRNLLILKDADHFAWTNLACKGKPAAEAVKRGTPRLVTQYTTAFFRRWLMDDQVATAFLRATNESLDRYEYVDPE